MLHALRRWLDDLLIADPVDRRQGLLLQLLLLVLLLMVAVGMLGNVLIFGAAALSPWGLLPNVLLALVAAGALALLRRGLLRRAAGVVVSALLLGQAYALLGAGLDYSPAQLLVFILPITLAGLVMGQAALIATTATSLLIAAVAALVPPGLVAGQMPVAGTLFLFVVVAVALSLMLDRFAGTLREALGEAAALAAENARLLRESDARFQALADSAPVLIWVADATGGYTFFNQTWLTFTGRTIGQELGDGWVAGVHPDDRERCLSTYKEAFAARRPFSRDYRLRHADGRYRWVLDNGVPRFAPDGRFAGFIGSCVDITERYLGERYLRTQHRVAQLLAEAHTADEAVGRVLALVAESLGWDWGAMWVLDKTAGALRCAEIWARPELDLEPLARASRRIGLKRGDGFLGSVWEKGAPIWVRDLATEAGIMRSRDAAALGLRGALAVPIAVDGAFVGAMEFFRRGPYLGDPPLLDAVEAIGAQVGQFLERIEALQALQTSEGRYKALIESSPHISWVLTPAGAVEYFNTRWSEYTGLSREASLGMGWIEACHPEDRAGLVELRSASIEAGNPYQTTLRLCRADGVHRWHLVRVVPVEEGGSIVAWFGTAVDIQELKQAEDAQRFLTEATTALASSLAYETTLARVAELAVPTLADWCVVHLCDADGGIATVAQAHRDPEKQALAGELARRYPALPDAAYGPAKVISSGAPEFAPVVNPAMIAAIVHDGAHAAMLAALGLRSYLCVPILLEGRSCGSIAMVAAEPGRFGLDDLRLAEELARRAALAIQNARLYNEAREAVAVRDQFLSIASHELKTPLTALLGYAQLLHRRQEREPNLAERDLRALRTIVAQGERLERLVNLLLDLSRIELGQLKIERATLDMVALVREAVADMQPGLERHALALELPATPLLIDGDALRLDQVLQNLLQNAVKYSPAGGTISVRLAAEGDELVLAVSDEGIGIPAAALPSLFSRFYRAPNAGPYQIGGTGIGLYVVREIVAHHGGTVEVESVEGRGSTFTVRLPLAAARAEAVGAI